MSMPVGLEPNPVTVRFADRVSEWTDVFGMAFATNYGDPNKEYEALREAVVALEYSSIRKWFIQGPDAVTTADRVFSRNVKASPIGRVLYGVVTDNDGYMIEEMTLVKLSPESVLVFGGDPLTQQQFEAAAPEGTTVTDRRADYAAASLQGPLSRALLQRLTTTDVSHKALPYYHSVQDTEVAGVPALISRLGFTAELGYEVMVPVEHADTLWDAILDQQELGLELMGLDALLVARTEAGMVMSGLEYDRCTTPFECGLGWTVDFEKGTFQGRDALAEKKKSPATRLVSLETTAPAGGLDGRQLLVNGRPVGKISMAVVSPVLQRKTLALARVETSHANVGSVVSVDSPDGPVPAVVRHTPTYDPERTRVKS